MTASLDRAVEAALLRECYEWLFESKSDGPRVSEGALVKGYYTPEFRAFHDRLKAALPVACGGCGESDPDKRCLGCLHPFYPALPHLGVDREALRGLVAEWREALGHDDFGCHELRARDMAVEKCADELDGIINVNQEP